MQCVGLNQDAIEIKCAEQFLESRLFTGFVRVIRGLGQGHAEGSGVDGDLGNEPVVAVFCLDGGAPQGFAVADQLVQTLCPTWDLGDHPGLQHLAEFLQVGLVEQVEKGGIGGPALEVQAQRLVQRFPVPLLLRRSLRLGLQQRLIERREVQPLAAILLGAHVAALAHQFGLGGIAEGLDLGEEVCSGEHDQRVELNSILAVLRYKRMLPLC